MVKETLNKTKADRDRVTYEQVAKDAEDLAVKSTTAQPRPRSQSCPSSAAWRSFRRRKAMKKAGKGAVGCDGRRR